MSIVLLSVSSILGIFVFWLCGYHQYLMCRNETTNENLKGSYKKLGNPFQKGCIDNLQRLFSRDKRNWYPEQVITREPMAPLSGGVMRRKTSMPRMLRRQSVGSNNNSHTLRQGTSIINTSQKSDGMNMVDGRQEQENYLAA